MCIWIGMHRLRCCILQCIVNLVENQKVAALYTLYSNSKFHNWTVGNLLHFSFILLLGFIGYFSTGKKINSDKDIQKYDKKPPNPEDKNKLHKIHGLIVIGSWLHQPWCKINKGIMHMRYCILLISVEIVPSSFVGKWAFNCHGTLQLLSLCISNLKLIAIQFSNVVWWEREKESSIGIRSVAGHTDDLKEFWAQCKYYPRILG